MPSLPFDASAEGHRIDGILRFANWAGLVICSILALWLLASFLHSRFAAPVHPQEDPKKEAVVPLAFALLLLVAVDGVLLLRSHGDMQETFLRADEALVSPGAARVQILARQWAWEARYPGADQRFGSEDDHFTVGLLVVPKGRATVYELSSQDVVHALYAPNFRVKQDAIPGRVVRSWFQAKELGNFELACAQHCGFHHYLMKGHIRVLSSEDYDAWVKRESEVALSVVSENQRAEEEEASAIADELPWTWRPAERSWVWPWGGEKTPVRRSAKEGAKESAEESADDTGEASP